MPGHGLLSACHNNVHADFGPQNIQSRQKLLGKMSSGSFLQLCALLAIPFAFGPIFRCQTHTLKVKPLDGTVLIVTSNHLTKRYTLTVTVDWLTRVYSCWNCICCPCIASKRSSELTKMYSGACIAPLQLAPVGQKMYCSRYQTYTKLFRYVKKQGAHCLEMAAIQDRHHLHKQVYYVTAMLMLWW